MKPVIICIACSCLLLQNIISQDSLKSGQAKTHRALLARITFSETQSMKVHIMNIKDSAVFVYQKASGKPDPFHKVNIYNEAGWDSYNYRFIESVKVRNKKLRSWLLPVAIVGGFVAGALIGYASAKDDGVNGLENQGAGIIIGGIVGGGAGTLTGLLICNAYEKKYMINGDWKSFEEMKRSMNY
ncbi:MAG TPA: hypothetical protein VK622_08285 [Puia sp.]|nr:hypothetical protein [Puia sp.]